MGSGQTFGAPTLLARAHHGSVSKEQRAIVEEDLKRGLLKAVVATSSLELGIDMGAVDLVIQVEAPPSVASGLAAHRPGRPSGRRGLARGAVPQASHRPDRLRGERAADAGRPDRDDASARQPARHPGAADRGGGGAGAAGRRPMVRHRAPQPRRSRRCRAASTRPPWTCCRASTRPPSSPSCDRDWSTTATPAP